jgi:hypothetical protein
MTRKRQDTTSTVPSSCLELSGRKGQSKKTLMLSVRAKASNGASLVGREFRRVYLRKREREYGRWRPKELWRF